MTARSDLESLSWRAVLDRVAKEWGLPTSADTKRLSQAMRELSLIYNDDAARAPQAHRPDDYAARLHFQFIRDVPKMVGALQEAISARTLPKRSRLRILDLGAGLGAMSWAAVDVAQAFAPEVAIELTLVDSDEKALKIASSIARAREARNVQAKYVHASVERFASERGDHSWDWIIAGNVISELGRQEPEGERITRVLNAMQFLFERLPPEGMLVIVEPALKTRTRFLHRLRDEWIGRHPGTLLAPCVAEGPCPMLANERDWCHEDRSIDLPTWLVPVAKGAGLRWQGLTYSFLALGASIARELTAASHLRRLRVVAVPERTKGKVELQLCGDWGTLATRSVRLLDRDHTEENSSFSQASRGDVLQLEGLEDSEAPRVRPDTKVRRH